MKYFDVFIQEIASGNVELFNNNEFHLLDFAAFCQKYDPKISDMRARELLYPYEKTGKIQYTELLYFKLADDFINWQ